MSPAYYRWASREQISHYDTVSMLNGTVRKIESKGTPERSLFTVTADLPQDEGERTFEARKIILSTGMKDTVPSTPGLSEAWGKGVFWCPWCDGHEHIDQPLGILGPLPSIPGFVRQMLTLNTDLVAFINGTDTETARAETDKALPNWEAFLQLHNVTVYNQTLKRIERLRFGTDGTEDASLPTIWHNDLFRVEFVDDDTTVERAGFIADFPTRQASNLGRDLGVNMLGTKLAADASKGHVTNVPGVYAVGDANSDNSTNVPHALYSGKRASVFLHSTYPC